MFYTGPSAGKWLWWVFLPLAVYILATPGGLYAALFGLWLGR